MNQAARERNARQNRIVTHRKAADSTA